MATRSGAVDPGLLVWLLTEARVSVDELGDGLEHLAGLLGLSGASGDMREVVDRRDRGDEACRLAFDVYVHRLVGDVARMAAALGGMDAITFTGGVGSALRLCGVPSATGSAGWVFGWRMGWAGPPTAC